jgi:membrane-associated phospholipid phosphatase
MIGWDESILLAVYAARTPAGIAFFSNITHLGGAVMITAVFIAASIVLSRGRAWAHALGLIVALAGSVVLSHLLKNMLQFSRPDEVLWTAHTYGYGFPSSHATAAMALYGFLIWYVWEKAPRWKIPALLFFGSIILLVGFSRIYMGVHFLTDVAGGYLLGAIFVWIGVRATRRFERFEL